MSAIKKLLTDNIDIWTVAETEKRSGRGRASTNAGSVYGIKKLRELILELAVRGKLVPQDASDEPASELLMRIRAGKTKSLAEGKIKKSKSLRAVAAYNSTFTIPNSWSSTRFDEIFSLEYGDNLPAEKRTNSGEYPVYGSNGVVGTHNRCFVQSSCIVVGRKGSAGALNLCLASGCCVTDVAYFCIPPEEMDLHFSFKLFQSLGLDILGKGIKPGLSRSEAYVLPIAIPPIAEQHRIVAKVDELMALCDHLETQHGNTTDAHEQLVSHLLGALTQSQSAADFDANWRRMAAHFDTLFTTKESIDALQQTLLQLAVMGKLAQSDSNDEPASALLQRIKIEKAGLIAEDRMKKEKGLPALGKGTKPFGLPDQWEWVQLGNIIEVSSSKRIHVNDYVSEGVPFFRSKEIGELQRGELISTNIYISRNKYEELRNLSGFPKINDLMLTSVGSIGNTWLCDGRDFYYKDGNITKLSSSQFVSMRFLQYFIASPLFRDQVLDTVSGTAYNALTIVKLNALNFPLPPIAEQYRIVAKIDELVALCNEMKGRINSAGQLRRRLADLLVECAVV